jgi:hypothetical protein
MGTCGMTGPATVATAVGANTKTAAATGAGSVT